MAIDFPRDQEPIHCPHCNGDRAYARLTSNIQWVLKGGRHPGRHYLHIAYCQTCGGCIIQKDHPGGWSEIIYPKGPTRSMAPKEVRELEKGLADTYDEAVACEAFSTTAAVFLLGRCAEFILVEKAEAPKGETLGPQIAAAIKAGALREPIAGYMKDAFKHARNQSGHYWTDAEGNEMKVDEETVDRAFVVVDMMLDEFLIRPSKMEAWKKAMKSKREEKLQGDKS